MFADIHLKQDLAALLPGLTGGIKVALDNTAAYWDSNTKNFGYESAGLNLETGEKEFNTHANEGTLSYSKSVGSVTTHFNLRLMLTCPDSGVSMI